MGTRFRVSLEKIFQNKAIRVALGAPKWIIKKNTWYDPRNRFMQAFPPHKNDSINCPCFTTFPNYNDLLANKNFNKNKILIPATKIKSLWWRRGFFLPRSSECHYNKRYVLFPWLSSATLATLSCFISCFSVSLNVFYYAVLYLMYFTYAVLCIL